MSKLISAIPRSQIERLQIYINKDKKTLAEIKAETGADYLMNGGLYDMAHWIANCQLKAEGYVHAQDSYTYWGYGWDVGTDIAMQIVPVGNRKNYIACVELIRNSAPNGTPIYTPAQGGIRGRTAIGIAGDKLCLYVSSDGSSDARTPEALRDELAALGCDSAIMLDSGGSSQCDFLGSCITSQREVHNLILVFLKKGGDKPVSDKKYTVCLDPGHGPGCVNGDPDGTYKEHEFAMDMADRVAGHLQRCGFSVFITRNASGYPSLSSRCKVSNDAKADLFVSLHSNAAGGSGWSEASGLLVITSAGPDTAQRNVAAQALIKRFLAAGIAIRGSGLTNDKTLAVLTGTLAPACLIEYGFHTNQGDVAQLKDSAYRDKLAVATAKGICDFLGVAYKETVQPEASWYEQDQKWAVGQGISDGTRPNDSCTRAEVWAMLRSVSKE